LPSRPEPGFAVIQDLDHNAAKELIDIYGRRRFFCFKICSSYLRKGFAVLPLPVFVRITALRLFPNINRMVATFQ
jgi:hypothetical protein